MFVQTNIAPRHRLLSLMGTRSSLNYVLKVEIIFRKCAFLPCLPHSLHHNDLYFQLLITCAMTTSRCQLCQFYLNLYVLWLSAHIFHFHSCVKPAGFYCSKFLFYLAQSHAFFLIQTVSCTNKHMTIVSVSVDDDYGGWHEVTQPKQRLITKYRIVVDCSSFSTINWQGRRKEAHQLQVYF